MDTLMPESPKPQKALLALQLEGVHQLWASFNRNCCRNLTVQVKVRVYLEIGVIVAALRSPLRDGV